MCHQHSQTDTTQNNATDVLWRHLPLLHNEVDVPQGDILDLCLGREQRDEGRSQLLHLHHHKVAVGLHHLNQLHRHLTTDNSHANIRSSANAESTDLVRHGRGLQHYDNAVFNISKASHCHNCHNELNRTNQIERAKRTNERRRSLVNSR